VLQNIGGMMMPITHSRYRQELETIIAYVNRATFHPFAARYVTSPHIDLLQLHFSYVFLKVYDVSDPQDICIPQILIQVGLELHDQVQIADDRSENEVKKKQLSVLLGDYYSSHYFRYLAERNKIEWVEKWALVVQQLNILKMDMHLQKEQTGAEIFREQKFRLHQISTQAILDWHGADSLWYDLLETLVVWQSLTADDTVQAKDLDRIHQLHHQATQLLEQLGPEWMKQELNACWVRGMSEDLLVSEP
jgi:heptaprenyl diphosphate synthase